MRPATLRDQHRSAAPAVFGDPVQLPDRRECFKKIASTCLQTIQSNRELAISADPEAIHRMRIELTRLRAAALFFVPVSDDAAWPGIDPELRWLNSALGRARNRDVTIEYADRKPYRSWAAYSRRNLLRSKDKAHRRLAGKLGSARYTSLISKLSDWISKVPSPRSSEAQRFDQADVYCDARLREWKDEISRQGLRLRSLRRKSIHRLRIQSKNYRYIVEAVLELDIPVSRQNVSFYETAKRVHQALGELRDLRQLRKAVGRRPPHYRKRKRRLIQLVENSFRRLS